MRSGAGAGSETTVMAAPSKRPLCEAGAYYDERGKIHYVCKEPAAFQMVMNGEDLLIVYCTEHAGKQGVLLVAGSPKVRLEYLPWE